MRTTSKYCTIFTRTNLNKLLICLVEEGREEKGGRVVGFVFRVDLKVGVIGVDGSVERSARSTDAVGGGRRPTNAGSWTKLDLTRHLAPVSEELQITARPQTTDYCFRYRARPACVDEQCST